MTEQLESDLRAALARRADAVPTQAVERLRRVEYRPRVRRRWPLTVSGLGAASGTAVVVSVVVLGGSQTAFAGWSATPTTPTADQTVSAQSSCQANLPAALAQGSWTQLDTDVRGPYTVAVFQSGTSLASCLTGPSFTTVEAESLTSSGMMASASGSSAGPGSGPLTGSSTGEMLTGGDIEQLMVGHYSQSGDGPYTLVEGRIDPGVSAVTLDLSDGQDVVTTTGSGWLVAWWPGSEDVTSARITSSTGTTTVALSAVAMPAPPPPPGTGSGGSSGQTAVPANGNPLLSPAGSGAGS